MNYYNFASSWLVYCSLQNNFLFPPSSTGIWVRGNHTLLLPATQEKGTLMFSIRSSLILSAVVAFIVSPASAQVQPPEIEWEKTFGGVSMDIGHSVKQTTDGGYVAAGWTNSFSTGPYDAYLIKTDASGNLEWQKRFGGAKDEYSFSVQQTTDGGYIAAGRTYSFGAGEWDAYLIKTNAHGDLEWDNTFGGANHDEGWSVQQTADKGYIVAGETNSFGTGNDADVYLIKTNARGDLEWEKVFGGANHDAGRSVQQTTDGGFIVAGLTESFGAGMADIYLIKTDRQGNLLWQKTFGDIGNEVGFSLQQTTDGGYIAAGQTFSFGAGGGDVYLVKTDRQGNLDWQRTISGGGDDLACSVQQTLNGGYIVGGWTWPVTHGDANVYLIKTDSDGIVVWQKKYGGAGNDLGLSVQQTNDGGFIVAGQTFSFEGGESDVYLVKLSPEKPEGYFIRGDANADGGLNITDPIITLLWLFLGAAPPTCLDAADADDSGSIDITDAIYTLGHLFLGKAAPPPPHPEAGLDTTPDALGCNPWQP